MAKVCVLGMGFVGLTLSAVLAQKGHEVHGVDPNEKLINSLKENKPHFHENGLIEVLKNYSQKIFYYTSHPKQKMDCYIVCVGTPINNDKSVNDKYVIEAAQTISQNISGSELIMLRSTVKVGICRNIVKKILDSSAKKYFLAFCPERAIEGKAIEEQLTLPQIIGGIDKESTAKADEFFKTIVAETVLMNSIEEAEMVKLLNNSYRDLTFAFANEVALMCNSLGIDTNKTIEAANYNYKRSNIPKPGFVGGTCLTKDSYILSQSAQNLPGKKLVTMARELNESMPQYVAQKIAAKLKSKSAKIFISGLAFKGKPETDDTRNSPTLDLILHLQKSGFTNVSCHDFAISEQKTKELGFNYQNLEDGAKQADCIIIGNNNQKYSACGLEEIISKKNSGLIFDVWNVLDKKKVNNFKIDYLSL